MMVMTLLVQLEGAILLNIIHTSIYRIQTCWVVCGVRIYYKKETNKVVAQVCF